MKNHLLCILLLLTTFSIGVQAQNKLKFSVAEFAEDPFDTSARDKQYEKRDGNGQRFAIIKVSGDKLESYKFDFGNMRHEAVMHDDVLWLYVQDKAQHVTITRNGYTTINKHPLHPTIEAAKNYVMVLNAEAEKVRKQMVQFNITPPDAKAMIMYRQKASGSTEQLFGMVDNNGKVAKALPLGAYHYRVVAENHEDSEGEFNLRGDVPLFEENVKLALNVAAVTLTVDADAEIYMDGVLLGTRSWTGQLQKGSYQIECRQNNHNSTYETITIEDVAERTFALPVPTQRTGTLLISSNPLGANIRIDNSQHGATPMTLSMPVGRYTLMLSLDGYKAMKKDIEVRENEDVELACDLEPVRQSQKKEEKPAKQKEEKPVKQKVEKPAKPKSEKKDKASSNGQKEHQPAFYVQASGQAGQLNGIGANVGGYINRINLEASFTKGLGKENVYYNSGVSYNRYQEVLSCMSFGGKVGYRILIGKVWVITPQIGLDFLKIHDSGSIYESDFYDKNLSTQALSATIGGRLEYGFSRHFGLSLTPEYRIAFIKDDIFKAVADVSSKVKGWGTGISVRLGVYVCF